MRRVTVLHRGLSLKSTASQSATVEVGVPVTVAYDQWTRFEEFPMFMKDVSQVRQIDDATLEWRAETTAGARSWRSTIVEREPNRVIAWKSDCGAKVRVELRQIGADRTAVAVTSDVDFREGAVAGDDPSRPVSRTKPDLARFKEFVERKANRSGAR